MTTRATIAGRLPRGVVVVSVLASIVVAVQLARIAVYMVRPEAAGWSVAPCNAFTTTHSCLVGYWAAARQMETEPNVWSDDLWDRAAADARRTACRATDRSLLRRHLRVHPDVPGAAAGPAASDP